MRDLPSRDPVGGISGIFFDLEELQALCGIGFPDLDVEIEVTDPEFEEIAIFRLSAMPSVVVATVHKNATGTLVLTGVERTDPDGPPACLSKFADVAPVGPALKALVAR